MMRRLSIALMGVLLMGLAVNTSAQPKPAAAKASFQVKVIEASKGAAPYLDKRLETMNRHFKPFRGRYNRFILLTARQFKLALGETGTVKLSKKKNFVLQFSGFSTGKVRRARYSVQMPHTRIKRSVAPGGQTMDVIRQGEGLLIISTLVR